MVGLSSASPPDIRDDFLRLLAHHLPSTKVLHSSERLSVTSYAFFFVVWSVFLFVMHFFFQMQSIVVDVAGASFNQNPGNLTEGHFMTLVRVPSNRVHSNAIAVMDKDNLRAGWIPRGIADSLAPELDSGMMHIDKCVVEEGKRIRLFFRCQKTF